MAETCVLVVLGAMNEDCRQRKEGKKGGKNRRKGEKGRTTAWRFPNLLDVAK